MKYNTILNTIFAAFFAGAILASCTKVATPTPLGDAGQTIVKIYQGLADTASGYSSGYTLSNIDLVATPQVLKMVDIRRDAANNADLNTTMTVKVQADPGAVSAYNSTLVPLPAGSYTVDPSTPIVGTEYTVTLAPGEISKEIKITILNAQTLDLNNAYGMGFTISNVDGNGKIAGLEKSMVVEIGIKNRWDGQYIVTTNSFTDLVNSALVGYASWKANLVTTGQYTDDVILTDIVGTPALASATWLNDHYHPIINTTTAAGSVYGNFGPIFTFNESNAIVSVTNWWGDPTPTDPGPGPTFRSAVLDPTGVNQVGSNRNFRVKYKMLNRASATAPDTERTLFDETWIYQGPR